MYPGKRDPTTPTAEVRVPRNRVGLPDVDAMWKMVNDRIAEGLTIAEENQKDIVARLNRIEVLLQQEKEARSRAGRPAEGG